MAHARDTPEKITIVSLESRLARVMHPSPWMPQCHCYMQRCGMWAYTLSLLSFDSFPPVFLFGALRTQVSAPRPAVARALQVHIVLVLCNAPRGVSRSSKDEKFTRRCYWALSPSAYVWCRIAGARRPPRLPRSPRPQCPPPAHPGCCSSPERRVGRPQKHSPPNSPGIGFGLGSGRVRVRVGAAELALRQPGAAFKLRLWPVESCASSGALL